MSDPKNAVSMTADRKRGILTKRDRELLLGEDDYENNQQLRDARYRIRQRIIAALLDIQLLAYNYPLSEHATVVETMYEDKYQPDSRWVYDYTADLFDFGVGMATAGMVHGHVADHFEFLNEDIEPYLEHMIQRSIEATEEKHRRGKTVLDVDVDITIDRQAFDEDAMIQRLVHGTTDSRTLGTYLDHGDVGKLREQLRKFDEEIVYPASEGDEARIGPDHPWLQYHS